MATAKEIWALRNAQMAANNKPKKTVIAPNPSQSKPLEQMNKASLLEIAAKLEIMVHEGATNKEIVSMIKEKQGK
jgi:hypothetical protein